jgi:outer membrane receptor protein involved in Fe transport
MARHRFIDEMKATARITNPANTTPSAKAASYVDLEARWSLSEATDLRFGVINAFDPEPVTINGTPGSTDATLYDVIGRRFYVALRQTF